MRFFKSAGLKFPEIDRISTNWLKRSWKKRDALPKKLKDPKFRATAKLKDYKSSL